MCTMFPVFDKVPARLKIAIMMFTASWMSYMVGNGMSVNIIAMVSSNSSGTSIKSECEAPENSTNSLSSKIPESFISRELRHREDLETFDWTAEQQGFILSAYYWSYAVTCLIGGRVVEVVGPKILLFSTFLISAVLNALCPQAARIHYVALVAFRFIIGLFAGFTFPALHDLLARWAPPDEKSKFASALLGGGIGTVFTWTFTGLLIERFGWDYAFYVPGVLIAVWCIVWWYLVYDSPVEHPRISEEEKHYILKAIGDKVKQASKNRSTPPFKKIFTSPPFLAMLILHYGNCWGIYFMITAAPKFISSALGFKLSSTGTLASLPYVARVTFSVIFAAIGDRFVRLNFVSLTFIRKFFSIFSHIIPGVLLIILGYIGCAPILSITLITFSLGSNGAATLTNLVNHQDLAPNYAATIFGIANGFGNTAGFVTPLVTAYFTKNGNSFAEWRPVFLTGGSLYIASAIYFILFGTAETQSWNYISTDPDGEENGRKMSSTNSNKITAKV